MASPTNPSEIARETLKALATSKLPPTPDNYAQAYRKISGEPAQADGAMQLLQQTAEQLQAGSTDQRTLGQRLQNALLAQDWSACQQALLSVLKEDETPDLPALSWSGMIRDLLRQLEIPHKGITLLKKKEGVETVLARFSNNPAILHEKLQNLLRSWSHSPAEAGSIVEGIVPAESEIKDDPSGNIEVSAASGATAAAASGSQTMLAQLRELLAATVESSEHTHPELAAEIKTLALQARSAGNTQQLNELANQLRKFWFKLELRGGDKARIQEGLLRLLRLLVENVSELVADDKWINGQISTFREIIDKPMDKQAIADAERNLRNAIIRQSTLKHSLSDAKSTLKSLMTTFIDRLGSITASTGDYHSKIEGYSAKISSTDNITELSHILSDIMQDTRIIQASAQRTHEELTIARKQAEEAEERVRKLERELEEISDLVREDQLTGALNRRGLEETLNREFSRTEREQSQISVALLDIDNFKQLNDTLGHQGGDEALKHLAKVIKDALRPSDSVARYGGEEFIIILPDTPLETGMEIVERLQRELTRRFFLHNNERRLITFSAGVATRQQAEVSEDLIGRADNAMYQAKRAGKNRVVSAK